MKNRNGELCKYCVQCDKPCPYGFFNDDICTLTEEQCRKRRFVQNHLEPLGKENRVLDKGSEIYHQ